ncbi:DUF2079 domain-containing protein [Candidatus Uhrbacteria bacterium]|nr:DUF2079 domain-containing protein [Candidatus Uhrbacteria bacterium]
MTTALVMYYFVGTAATFVAAAFSLAIALRRGWNIPRRLLIGAIAVVPFLLLVQQLLKYASLHMYADFSHWLQLLQGIVTTGKPYVLSHELVASGTLNYLSVHFVSLIYVFAIPLQLFPYPQTLIVLNAVAMCSAAIPLYLLARQRTGDRRFALLIAALLLWYPTFQYTTLYEFEMLRFSIPILLWMLYAWERQRIPWYYALVILATLVREEAGLTVGMFGVYVLLFERRRVHGIVTTLLGFVAFGVITQFVMPALRGPGAEAHIAQGFFNTFGATPVAVIFGLLQHPFRALAFAVNPIKIANLGMLFLPLLFLPLLAPTALIPAIATFAIGLVSSSTSYTHTSYLLYYVTPAIPFLFWACMRAWPRTVEWLARRTGADVVRIGGAVACAMVVGSISAQVFFGPSPLALQFWSDRFRPAPFKTQSFHWSAYRVTDRAHAVDELIAMIPRDAIVSTQQFLMPRLSRVRGVLPFPQIESRDHRYRANYILLDRRNNGLRPESPAYTVEADQESVFEQRDLELLRASSDYALYVRGPGSQQ